MERKSEGVEKDEDEGEVGAVGGVETEAKAAVERQRRSGEREVPTERRVAGRVLWGEVEGGGADGSAGLLLKTRRPDHRSRMDLERGTAAQDLLGLQEAAHRMVDDGGQKVSCQAVVTRGSRRCDVGVDVADGARVNMREERGWNESTATAT